MDGKKEKKKEKKVRIVGAPRTVVLLMDGN
jgi:hypothetical protein